MQQSALRNDHSFSKMKHNIANRFLDTRWLRNGTAKLKNDQNEMTEHRSTPYTYRIYRQDR